MSTVFKCQLDPHPHSISYAPLASLVLQLSSPKHARHFELRKLISDPERAGGTWARATCKSGRNDGDASTGRRQRAPPEEASSPLNLYNHLNRQPYATKMNKQIFE